MIKITDSTYTLAAMTDSLMLQAEQLNNRTPAIAQLFKETEAQWTDGFAELAQVKTDLRSQLEAQQAQNRALEAEQKRMVEGLNRQSQTQAVTLISEHNKLEGLRDKCDTFIRTLNVINKLCVNIRQTIISGLPRHELYLRRDMWAKTILERWLNGFLSNYRQSPYRISLDHYPSLNVEIDSYLSRYPGSLT